jgi:hypothetical protein
MPVIPATGEAQIEGSQPKVGLYPKITKRPRVMVQVAECLRGKYKAPVYTHTHTHTHRSLRKSQL